MGSCCSSTIPDIEGRFPAIEIVSIMNDDAPDPAVKPGPQAETFENLNFSDSSSVDAEMEHLSQLLASPKKEKDGKKSANKEKGRKKRTHDSSDSD